MDSTSQPSPARMRDVAQAAGVSPTTVSHALNGKGRVDPETVAHVRAVAARLGYTPNPTARNLRQGRTGLLGLVNSVDPDLPVALTDLTTSCDWSAPRPRPRSPAATHSCSRPRPISRPSSAHRSTGSSSLTQSQTIPSPPKQIGLAVPTVTVGRDPSLDPEAGWWVDNALDTATETMLDHLKQSGARRIALITPPPVHSWGVDMIHGYQTWADQHGDYQRIVIAHGGLTESAGHAAATEVLSDPEPPDAIHCVIDRYALGALLAAQALGISVPNDLFVTAGPTAKSPEPLYLPSRA